MLVRTGSVLSRKSCLRYQWMSRRRKPNLPSVLTFRVSAKRISKYELHLVPCASSEGDKRHQTRKKERPSIPNGAPNRSSVCWTCRLRLTQMDCTLQGVTA